MNYDELLAKINKSQVHTIQYVGLASEIEILTLFEFRNAIRAVVELHKPKKAFKGDVCEVCYGLSEDYGYRPFLRAYPCPTIKAIEKEME